MGTVRLIASKSYLLFPNIIAVLSKWACGWLGDRLQLLPSKRLGLKLPTVHIEEFALVVKQTQIFSGQSFQSLLLTAILSL
jgi:hypothetical protein